MTMTDVRPREGRPDDRGGAARDVPGSGQAQLRSHAAAPSVVDRALGGVLRVLRPVTTPLLPTDYLDVLAPLHTGADLRGRIEHIQPETADAATIVIRPGRGWAGHIPGQYVRIGVDVDGVRLWRAYSLTSGPRRDGRLTITVKAIPDGRVSNHLVRSARPGTVIQMDQAAGDFHLPANPPARALFVTAGSGITPVMGMLRHRLATSPGPASPGPASLRTSDLRDVVVVHSAPTPADVIFGSELRDLAAAGLIRLVERHTDSDGLLAPADLARLVPDWATRQTWACGPTTMLDALEEHWAQDQADARLHTERFRPHVLVTGDGGAVSFARTGRLAQADGATPLLDVGEDAGVLMPSGCRMGICMGCVVPLEAGAVRDLRTGTVTTAERGDGVKIQTCVTAAAGPCEIGA
jgi:ferredoxin-NADP reductase